MEENMKFEVTYTINGFLNCFSDVVEVKNIDDCKAEVKKLVKQYIGSKKSIRIVLIKQIQGA
jgi:hypothetical protein